MASLNYFFYVLDTRLLISVAGANRQIFFYPRINQFHALFHVEKLITFPTATHTLSLSLSRFHSLSRRLRYADWQNMKTYSPFGLILFLFIKMY